MSYQYYEGQKVVCVNDHFEARHHPKCTGLIWPNDGAVYTIRSFEAIKNSYGKDVVILRFTEFSNPAIKWANISLPIEPGYARHRFRPLQKRKTDIQIFKAMLNPSKAKQAEFS